MENEQDRPEEAPTTVDAWEQRYADRPQVWSGRVNAALEEVVRTLPPGTALDIGSGEGGDVIWLASRGWRATGLDASKTAVERAWRQREPMASVTVAPDSSHPTSPTLRRLWDQSASTW